MKYIKSLNTYKIFETENSFSENYELVYKTISEYFQDIKLLTGDLNYDIIKGFLSQKNGVTFDFIKYDDEVALSGKAVDYTYAYWIIIKLTPDSNSDVESVIKGINNIHKLCNGVKEIISYLKRDKITKNYLHTLYVDDIIRLDNSAYNDDSSFDVRVLLYSDEYMSQEEINKYNESI